MTHEEDEQLQHPGLEWARRLKLGGCIAVLAFTGLCIFMMLNLGADPIKGYAPPQTDAYYAEHLDALMSELETAVIPHLEGVTDMYEKDGRLVIHIDYEHYIATRAAIMQYFDRDLFIFEQD